MPEDSYDILRRALIQALGPRPTPEQRRQVAADLRTLAEQQDRMAAAAAQAVQRSASGSEPGGAHGQERAAGFYVRLGREQDRQTGVVHVRMSLGHPLWSAIGGPARVDVQRVGPNIWIVGVESGGCLLDMRGSLPSCLLTSDGPLGQMVPGRYAAMVQVGAIVLGARVA